jgi:hypothetical protein
MSGTFPNVNGRCKAIDRSSDLEVASDHCKLESFQNPSAVGLVNSCQLEVTLGYPVLTPLYIRSLFHLGWFAIHPRAILGRRIHTYEL